MGIMGCAMIAQAILWGVGSRFMSVFTFNRVQVSATKNHNRARQQLVEWAGSWPSGCGRQIEQFF